MGKVWLVEVGDCAEIERQYVFATKEMADEFASREHFAESSSSYSLRAWVRELEILTELPPVEEKKPSQPSILILSGDGTSRRITDPEEMEKVRAETLASIHTWGGPLGALPFPTGTEAKTDEAS